MSTVTIALSAPTPLVSCWISSVRLLGGLRPRAWRRAARPSPACSPAGRPRRRCAAPASAAPCTALMPMPPMPVDRDGVAGLGCGRVHRGAAAGAARRSRSAPTLSSGHVVGDLDRRSPRRRGALGRRCRACTCRRSPRRRQVEAVRCRRAACRRGCVAPRSQRFYLPGGAPAAVPADRQERADRRGRPALSRVTPGADLLDDAGTLVPADEREARHDVAVARCSSEWHSPAATYWIRTSPAFGGSSSSSMISKGWTDSAQDGGLGLHRPS